MTLLAAEGYLTDVAYIDGYYPNLAPVAIRHAALVNGVLPPGGDGVFRYLELGCGSGRSLVTLAAAYPRAHFVGVDLIAEHIDTARRRAAGGQVDNVEFVCSDFVSVGDEVGHFDFVTLHGVLSWVTDVVRRQVVDLARRLLAPGGLLLVSYNATPGWAHLLPVRAILEQYARLAEGDSGSRAQQAVGYLAHLRDLGAMYFRTNPAAALFVDSLFGKDPRYLAHEFLNEAWSTFYVSEVAELFAGAGLDYAASLPLRTNYWDLCVGPEFHEMLGSSNDRLVTETHKDFCANTMFRWDIYARDAIRLDGVADRLRRADDLHFRLADDAAQLPHVVNLGLVSPTLDGELYEALVAELRGTSRVLSSLVAADSLGPWEADAIAAALDTAVATGLVAVCVGPLVTPTQPAADGRLTVPSPFNRSVLATADGSDSVVLASGSTGDAVMLGALDALLLREVVERGPRRLEERVAERLRVAGRDVELDGRVVDGRAARRAAIARAEGEFRRLSLPWLLRSGVVEAA